MESLVPPLLKAIQEVRWHILSGKSTKDAVHSYLEHFDDSFAQILRQRWILKWQSSTPMLRKPFASHWQEAFWELLERGCGGQPISEALLQLQEEVEKAVDHELELHIAGLPFKALVPLLLFQFPAFLLLLLGPIVRELQRSLGG